MRRTVADARRMAMGLDRLAQEQSFPWERVVVKAQLTKATHRDWQQAGREEQFQKLYQEQVLPAFRRLDAHHSGRGRFHLILTFTEA